MTPEELAGAQASFCDAVIMPIGMVRACTVITSRGGNDDHPAAMAALQYILAHELAHIFLSHSVSGQTVCFSRAVDLCTSL